MTSRQSDDEDVGDGFDGAGLEVDSFDDDDEEALDSLDDELDSLDDEELSEPPDELDESEVVPGGVLA